VRSAIKTLYIGSNLKMYKNIEQTLEFFRRLDSLTEDIQGPNLCLFAMAAYPALFTVHTGLPGIGVRLGAQDIYWEEYGPYTGAISPLMLKECGVQVVQVGHSERRQYFGETDASVNKKVLASLKHGFIALVCVGETAEEKNWGVSVERVREQTKIALAGIEPAHFDRLWIAYEPAWAIGPKGTPATPEYAARMQGAVRQLLLELSLANGNHVPILYGGSVNAANAVEFIAKQEIDGLYIGRSAYDTDEFNALIRNVRGIWLRKSEIG
jgi:triosephosphate isomerase